MIRSHKISVHSEFDTVVLELGNVEVKLPYETAFQLSQWLRIRAKEAKRFSGDKSRHWSFIGTLTGGM